MDRLFSNKKIVKLNQDVNGYACTSCDVMCASNCISSCSYGCNHACNATCSIACFNSCQFTVTGGVLKTL